MHTAVKRVARAQFQPKLSLNKVLNFRKFSLSSPKLRQSLTRTFSDGHPKVLPACNFLSQYYFYNIFLQKSCRFSLQTLTKYRKWRWIFAFDRCVLGIAGNELVDYSRATSPPAEKALGTRLGRKAAGTQELMRSSCVDNPWDVTSTREISAESTALICALSLSLKSVITD